MANEKKEFEERAQRLIDLKSSVSRKGDIVTQIICFDNGVKKTIKGIKTNTIEQSQYTKFECVNGKMVMINDAKVLWIEVFKEDD